MARMRVILVLLVAIAAGGGLALGTYTYMQNVPVKRRRRCRPRRVVVAATDLELARALRAEDLHVVEWPASSVPNGAFETPDEIVGRGLVMPVIQNEPILPMKLAGKEAGSGLPVVIPEGKRAVSVRVNDVIGVAGYVLPGTHVDVARHGDPDQQQGRHDDQSRPDQRAGAGGRHEDGTGRRAGQADGGERRHAARRRPKRPSA